jgi:hypothetical protein
VWTHRCEVTQQLCDGGLQCNILSFQCSNASF